MFSIVWNFFLWKMELWVLELYLKYFSGCTKKALELPSPFYSREVTCTAWNIWCLCMVSFEWVLGKAFLRLTPGEWLVDSSGQNRFRTRHHTRTTKTIRQHDSPLLGKKGEQTYYSCKSGFFHSFLFLENWISKRTFAIYVLEYPKHVGFLILGRKLSWV